MPTSNPFSPAREVARVFEGNSTLRERLKTDPDPLAVLNEAASQVEERYKSLNDKYLYRVAISVLGALAIIAALGSIVLAFTTQQPTPEVLVSLGSAAVGALVGLFAPAPNSGT